MIGELLTPQRVKLDLEVVAGEEALKQLVATHELKDPQAVLCGLAQREALMTSALGKGFALPRAFCAELGEPAASLGVFKKGLDFASLDHLPVKIMLVLLFPPGCKNYASYIASALNLLNQETVRTKIPQLSSPCEIIDFIIEKES